MRNADGKMSTIVAAPRSEAGIRTSAVTSYETATLVEFTLDPAPACHPCVQPRWGSGHVEDIAHDTGGLFRREAVHRNQPCRQHVIPGAVRCFRVRHKVFQPTSPGQAAPHLDAWEGRKEGSCGSGPGGHLWGVGGLARCRRVGSSARVGGEWLGFIPMQKR